MEGRARERVLRLRAFYGAVLEEELSDEGEIDNDEDRAYVRDRLMRYRSILSGIAELQMRGTALPADMHPTDFHRFELVGTLHTVPVAASQKCPFCGRVYTAGRITKHIRRELGL